MAAPFCNACGAALAEGQRFCVKCGSAVGQAAVPVPPPPMVPVIEETVVMTAPKLVEPLPPPPMPPPLATPPAMPTPVPMAPPPPQTFVPPVPPTVPPPPTAVPPMPMPAAPVSSGGGPGAGLIIGLLGLLLLLGGAGLWFYTTRIAKTHPVETAASDPVPQPAPAQPTPAQPTPAQPAPAPQPDAAPAPADNPPAAEPSAPEPAPKPEQIPPNPDFAKKTPPAARPSAPPTVAPVPAPSAPPAVPMTAPHAPPTSGKLHAAVEVAQYGEVVFEGLPKERLHLTFDHDAWQPTIHRQSNGTQTLVMRSLKPGIQRVCDVQWEIVR